MPFAQRPVDPLRQARAVKLKELRLKADVFKGRMANARLSGNESMRKFVERQLQGIKDDIEKLRESYDWWSEEKFRYRIGHPASGPSNRRQEDGEIEAPDRNAAANMIGKKHGHRIKIHHIVPRTQDPDRDRSDPSREAEYRAGRAARSERNKKEFARWKRHSDGRWEHPEHGFAKGKSLTRAAESAKAKPDPVKAQKKRLQAIRHHKKFQSWVKQRDRKMSAPVAPIKRRPVQKPKKSIIGPTRSARRPVKQAQARRKTFKVVRKRAVNEASLYSVKSANSSHKKMWKTRHRMLDVLRTMKDSLGKIKSDKGLTKQEKRAKISALGSRLKRLRSKDRERSAVWLRQLKRLGG